MEENYNLHTITKNSDNNFNFIDIYLRLNFMIEHSTALDFIEHVYYFLVNVIDFANTILFRNLLNDFKIIF